MVSHLVCPRCERSPALSSSSPRGPRRNAVPLVQSMSKLSPVQSVPIQPAQSLFLAVLQPALCCCTQACVWGPHLGPMWLLGLCVATLQGLTGSWYSCRRKNIHGAIGMSGIHGWASHACCKLPVYLHISWRGPCSPVWHPS